MEEMNLEETFKKLQETVESLETDSISLEDSFTKYEEGMRLLKSCHDKIDMVEKKVRSLNEAGDMDEF